MALLRPGRWGSRPQGGCLQRRTEAQRRPKGQHAGGTPALPGDAVQAVRWGVSGGRLLRKPTCTLWETPVCPRAVLPPCRADHSRVKQRTFMACREQGSHVPLIRLAVFGNIDRQDKQDEKLLQGKLTGSMIGCVFEVFHEPGSGFWESLSKYRRWLNSRRCSLSPSNPVHPVHRC